MTFMHNYIHIYGHCTIDVAMAKMRPKDECPENFRDSVHDCDRQTDGRTELR